MKTFYSKKYQNTEADQISLLKSRLVVQKINLNFIVTANIKILVYSGKIL